METNYLVLGENVGNSDLTRSQPLTVAIPEATPLVYRAGFLLCRGQNCPLRRETVSIVVQTMVLEPKGLDSDSDFIFLY